MGAKEVWVRGSNPRVIGQDNGRLAWPLLTGEKKKEKEIQ